MCVCLGDDARWWRYWIGLNWIDWIAGLKFSLLSYVALLGCCVVAMSFSTPLYFAFKEVREAKRERQSQLHDPRAHTARSLFCKCVFRADLRAPTTAQAGRSYVRASISFFFTKKINLMVFEREEWVSLRLLGSERAISF